MISPLITLELPGGNELSILKRSFGTGKGPRVIILAGIRGDAPEGIRVCHRITRFLETLDPATITSTIDVIPCINPLAAHHGARRWPAFDLDLNRRFPGRSTGHLPDLVVGTLSQQLKEADQIIELRGAHPAFREDTQALVSADSPQALERALLTNVQYVWRRKERAKGTLAEHFPDLIELEGGCGNRLTDGVGEALRDGVLNLLAELKAIPERGLPFHWAAIQRPEVIEDDAVFQVRAARGGLFHPLVGAGKRTKAGELLGEVAEPFTGEVLEQLYSPGAGHLLAVREQPVVYPGTLVARLVLE